MHSQTLSAATAHTTRQPQSTHSLPALSKPNRTVLRLIMTSTVLLGLGFAGWSMLRAEFDETFHSFPGCHTVAPNQMAS